MEDNAIIQLFLARNEQAIAKTAAKYGHYCRSIAMNILADPRDAEECVNDTYLQAWNAIPPHTPSPLSTFLGRITRNLSFNRYKHNAAQKRGGGEIPLVLEELSFCVSGQDDPSQAYDRKELIAAINAWLRHLPPRSRHIFLCRYWFTDSITDISRRFGISQGAVSMTLQRLRNKLQQHLAQRGFEL